MRGIIFISAIAVAFCVAPPVHAAKQGSAAQMKIKCQSKWAALTVQERNTWTAEAYLAACMAGKPVPIHGGPSISPPGQ